MGRCALALGAGHPVPALALVFAQGTLSFGVGSTLIARALYAAQGAPTLAGGFATAAFNVGAAVGPWAGGAVIGAGFGYRGPMWVSAALVALAFAVAGVAARQQRQRAVGQEPLQTELACRGTQSLVGAGPSGAVRVGLGPEPESVP
ncbi:hypothetical protein ACFUKV_12600 [Streptomyces paradoxus]|uniref:hypothetical protein n=1 Tax=Streptomyces paradoxus TaxID=66375 RepID=UPI00362CCDC3